MTHTDFQIAASAKAQSETTFRPLEALKLWFRNAIAERLAEQPQDPTASFGPRDWADMPVYHPATADGE
ncbi:hypothetical protein [Devosia sp.]|uniref:hypothetical protein n=1 Tax=Devosia sp. TaxID=1871048 RepID=UPI003BA9A0EE